jgi:hypothetical protein
MHSSGIDNVLDDLAASFSTAVKVLTPPMESVDSDAGLCTSANRRTGA